MATQLVVRRDQKLQPIQGRALAIRGDEDLVHVPFQPEVRWYFKPGVVAFMFMAAGGIIAFFIGALSL